MAKPSNRQVVRVRNAVIAFTVLVAIGVAGFGILYSSGVTESGFVAGEHYRVIEDPPRRRAGEPVRVREYFSYGCVHCRNFDPVLDEWKQTLPPGVVFSRSPVAFSPQWNLLAQTYLALQSLDALEENHPRLFRAIHDNGRQFQSAEAMADFIDGHGASRQQFLDAFNSQEVRRALRDADVEQRALVINTVPTLVVADRYVVNMDFGRKLALDIMDFLIAKELAAQSEQTATQ